MGISWKKVQERINSIQKRSLRAVYNDFSLDLPQLLLRGNHATIHITNVRRLIVKVFKCLNGEGPEILDNIFKLANVNRNLRINNLLACPNPHTKSDGLCSFRYRGTMTWNLLPDYMKVSSDSSVLKIKLKNFTPQCSCMICI